MAPWHFSAVVKELESTVCFVDLEGRSVEQDLSEEAQRPKLRNTTAVNEGRSL